MTSIRCAKVIIYQEKSAISLPDYLLADEINENRFRNLLEWKSILVYAVAVPAGLRPRLSRRPYRGAFRYR